MNVVLAVSTVRDGSMLDGTDPFDSTIIANHEKFLDKHRITMSQTTRVRVTYDTDNFTRYRIVSSADKSAGMADQISPADALVTDSAGHALFLGLADCVGAVLHDPDHHVLMLSHLGRHNLEQNGGSASVRYLIETFGSDPSTIKVWLTPAPSKASYPIWALDNVGMKEAVFAQLAEAGINTVNIIDDPTETDKDLLYYSHSEYLKGNREQDGRYAIVAMMSD